MKLLIVLVVFMSFTRVNASTCSFNLKSNETALDFDFKEVNYLQDSSFKSDPLLHFVLELFEEQVEQELSAKIKEQLLSEVRKYTDNIVFQKATLNFYSRVLSLYSNASLILSGDSKSQFYAAAHYVSSEYLGTTGEPIGAIVLLAIESIDRAMDAEHMQDLANKKALVNLNYKKSSEKYQEAFVKYTLAFIYELYNHKYLSDELDRLNGVIINCGDEKARRDLLNVRLTLINNLRYSLEKLILYKSNDILGVIDVDAVELKERLSFLSSEYDFSYQLASKFLHKENEDIHRSLRRSCEIIFDQLNSGFKGRITFEQSLFKKCQLMAVNNDLELSYIYFNLFVKDKCTFDESEVVCLGESNE